MKTICLDAGHGGPDPGAVANGLREADIAFEVVGGLARILRGEGFEVILSRPQPDVNPGINARWQSANAQGADYFISIHVNAGGGQGAETFYFRDSSERSRRSENFAHYVNNWYAERMGLRNRGVKPDTSTHIGAIGVLRQTRMPAILVELAFIDSPGNNPDVSLLKNQRGRMAGELADAMLLYFGIEGRRGTGLAQAGSAVDAAGEAVKAVEPGAMQTVTMDILGNIQEISGYIDNGATWVRLTDICQALGYVATWDEARRMPKIVRQGEAVEPPALDEAKYRAEILSCTEAMRLLKNIVHWEARGEDGKGQVLVTNVILNRVKSPRFPDSIEEVILAPGAFTPAKRPDFSNAKPSQLTIGAVQEALAGADYSQGATFFHQLSSISPEVWHERAVREGRLVHLFDHGDHRFYREI